MLLFRLLDWFVIQLLKLAAYGFTFAAQVLGSSWLYHLAKIFEFDSWNTSAKYTFPPFLFPLLSIDIRKSPFYTGLVGVFASLYA